MKKRLIKSSIDLDIIDYEPLYQHIEDLIGYDLDFTQESKTSARGNRTFIEMYSNDVLDLCGIFQSGLKSCRIECNSSDGSDDYINVWVNIRYKLKEGGSNGIPITVGIYKNGQWSFRDVE